MTAIIFKIAKSPMQSGQFHDKPWRINLAAENGTYTEPLMGWTGSSNMNRELELKFSTKEQAIAYAQSRGLDYEVKLSREKLCKPKSYADNFVLRNS